MLLAYKQEQICCRQYKPAQTGASAALNNSELNSTYKYKGSM